MTTASSNAPKKAGLLANISVARRIYLLLFFPLFIMIILGVISVFSVFKSYTALHDIKSRAEIAAIADQTARIIDSDYLLTMHRVQLDKKSWDQGETRIGLALQRLRQEIEPRLKDLRNQVTEAERMDVDRALNAISELSAEVERGLNIVKRRDNEQLRAYLSENVVNNSTTDKNSVNQLVKSSFKQTKELIETGEAQQKETLRNIGIIITAGLLLSAFFGHSIYMSIERAIQKLLQTVRRIARGDLEARAELQGKNELAELSSSFDNMVEERISTQAKIDKDHTQLNESVFALLQAVADLSDRNLTVRAKVTEDATGPLADAINQLAEDTTDVLKQVRGVAESVDTTASEVNQHAQSVNELARLEHFEAQETATQLNDALGRLESVADAARMANDVADDAELATEQAQSTVAHSLENMNHIRYSVRETSKRLKRLGERSQEISNITSLIDEIAERTNVLALNASMQATAAGDAGRGFSVIAEEIQRLAENSRDSTEQISTLISNIQQETNNTIATMDKAIEQVVSGSALAEDAAQQMGDTQEATNKLINAVEKIAEASAEQVSINRSLQIRAERIIESTESTGSRIKSLSELTDNMAQFGKQLVSSVAVFKLER